jgi:hypothetical protein
MPQAAASQAVEGEHKYTNRLAREQSPYLLQHAHNPVSATAGTPAVLLHTTACAETMIHDQNVSDMTF